MIALSTGLVRSIMTEYGFQSMMDRGVIELYPGSRPGSANDATPVPPIARITQDGGLFTPGSSPQFGLQLQESTELGTIASRGNWVCKGINYGTPTWFRWYWAQGDPRTNSVFYPRIDGTVGQDLVLQDQTVTSGSEFTLDAVYISLPQINIA